MSRAPLQSTLNEHVNAGAIRHYADRLERDAASISGYHYFENAPPPTHAEVIENLRAAAAALRIVVKAAAAAESAASRIHYDHLYKRGHWAKTSSPPPPDSDGPPEDEGNPCSVPELDETGEPECPRHGGPIGSDLTCPCTPLPDDSRKDS